MKLSRKGEYAILAMIMLSRSYKDKNPIKIITISKNYNIPKKFLEQIFILLKSKDYVESFRGVSGGYRLSKDPCNITVAEIYRIVDGPIAPVDSVSQYFYSKTPVEQETKVISLLKHIRNQVSEILEETTFDSLI